MNHRLIYIICITSFLPRERWAEDSCTVRGRVDEPSLSQHCNLFLLLLSSEGKFKERTPDYISKGNEIQTHTCKYPTPHATHRQAWAHLHTHICHTYPGTL